MLGFEILLVGLLGIAAAPLLVWGGDRPGRRWPATRSEVIARRGMAATSQPLATQIAIDTLKSGGSAVDAAIAANAALGLMEPTGCGVGGDLFAIVWDADARRLHGLNASGRAPAGATPALFASRGLREIPALGPLSVSVPGCVDGWFALHARFGKLPMAEVLAPTIGCAREGFPVSEVIAAHWAQGFENRRNAPGFTDTFLVDGRPPQVGEIWRNPALADSLETIAHEGRDAFYAGEIAGKIDAFCHAVDCPLRAEDLAAHTSEWVEPVSTNYRAYDVWELPPNGQGIAALQMLNLLEGFDLGALKHNSAAYLHLLIEAKKLAFEDRARFYADPAFVDADVARLISKGYAEERRALIQRDRAAATYPPGAIDWAFVDRKLGSGDTVYLTIADAAGNMVSLIQSNYMGFGSGLCPPGLGFGLQNRGCLFALDPAHPNVLAPGKRPFHTIIPAFVTCGGAPWLSFGVMGGDMQPQAHVQVLCNVIDFGMNLQEAGDAARWHHAGSSNPRGGAAMSDGGSVALESGITEEVRRKLAARGHVLENRPGVFGGYQAIGCDAGGAVYYGASESRKDGHAAGF